MCKLVAGDIITKSLNPGGAWGYVTDVREDDIMVLLMGGDAVFDQEYEQVYGYTTIKWEDPYIVLRASGTKADLSTYKPELEDVKEV